MLRIAIGITKPSGSTSWREFTNTSSGSVSYTFSERGLYTVVVAARDVATTEAHSCKETHTFKVRILLILPFGLEEAYYEKKLYSLVPGFSHCDAGFPVCLQFPG